MGICRVKKKKMEKFPEVSVGLIIRNWVNCNVYHCKIENCNTDAVLPDFIS